MVLQMPCPNQARVFVASSAEDEDQAHQEMQLWANGHGYQFIQSAPKFTIFRQDAQPREWVLLERASEAQA